jgi:hypothetical protein
MNKMKKLLKVLEDEIRNGSHTMLGLAQLVIALKVMEERLWNINIDYAQKCNDLQHLVFKEEREL